MGRQCLALARAAKLAGPDLWGGNVKVNVSLEWIQSFVGDPAFKPSAPFPENFIQLGLHGFRDDQELIDIAQFGHGINVPDFDFVNWIMIGFPVPSSQLVLNC